MRNEGFFGPPHVLEQLQMPFDLLFEQAAAHQATLLMVTHDHSILGRFDRVIDMRELASATAAR